MAATTRGATFTFGGSPWARQALLEDRDRAVELAHLAQALRVSVSMVGKAEHGPWVVHVRSSSRSLRFAGAGLHDVVEFGLDRWAAGADDAGIRWLAGADGLAHGQPTGRATWTLCHRPALDERFRHPERHRCQACWRALDRVVAA
jgi:hypothetical protein